MEQQNLGKQTEILIMIQGEQTTPKTNRNGKLTTVLQTTV